MSNFHSSYIYMKIIRLCAYFRPGSTLFYSVKCAFINKRDTAFA